MTVREILDLAEVDVEVDPAFEGVRMLCFVTDGLEGDPEAYQAMVRRWALDKYLERYPGAGLEAEDVVLLSLARIDDPAVEGNYRVCCGIRTGRARG